ncbi:PHP domain-containing protein [Natranaerobius thermophilus]|uniref:PHP domain protein n=1 Tax=Natranaerobius thermophilus (strain ATCC BAA-1301 / DSM 18059 / JW/NM-WN-LF) TaxID=457570 RepID=B2A3W0_NATTJ|nr:PHP domain-containing protein [Natranaerobius thermophilus]ACB85062.1 PHP domain protein [Natranaerobius thermophilus JW/NM-WN-LF]
MKCFGDLHIHTTASDGVLHPHEIIDRAEEKQIDYIAIADHDTFLGVEKLLVDKRLKRSKITLIPAIEISTDLADEELHILGYFNSVNNKQLHNALNKLREYREERITKIVDKLTKMRCPISLKKVYQHSVEGSIGRPHIAREMVKQGYVSSVSEAFEKYLAKDRPAYVKREKLTPEIAINMIREGGGIAVWAHPGITKNPEKSFQHLIDVGIQGIELYHPYHSFSFEISWRDKIINNNLIITGGSDFHDYEDPPVDLGTKGINCSEITKMIQMINE